MLRRSVKIQLILFLAITLTGVSYVSATYVGLFRGLFGSGGCTVAADFADSGGIFTNAEVTYRGVTVGRVGKLSLLEDGVRVTLRLDDCDDPAIPADTDAIVADRSVVGEQYVNLVPPAPKPGQGAGPRLRGGDVIPMSRTRIPVATEVLLANMDALVNSVDTDKLRTTVDELGKIFNGRGVELGSLLDSSNELLTAAQANLPQTIALLRNADTVLSTQLAERAPLASFTHSLALLSAQLKASDPDIRALLDRGPADLSVIRAFVRDNRTDLGVTLANLATTGQLLVRHLDGIEQILELYPVLAASAQTVLHDGVASLGMVLNVNDPPDCGDPRKGQQGYEGTTRRLPGDITPNPPNTSAHCAAPPSSGVNVRGSANVPGGDPMSGDPMSGGSDGGSDGASGAAPSSFVEMGNTGNAPKVLGDRSWIAILTGAVQ